MISTKICWPGRSSECSRVLPGLPKRAVGLLSWQHVRHASDRFHRLLVFFQVEVTFLVIGSFSAANVLKDVIDHGRKVVLVKRWFPDL